MDKEINDLQAQIDELNKLFAEADVFESANSVKEERLGIMLLKLQDNNLEKRFVKRLEKWLMADRKCLSII